jgi:nucleotide-binding universal stress UspA family protein
MYRRILLVPTDGSPCSDYAVGEAARLARVLGAEVTVLCVVDVFAKVRDGLVNATMVVEEARREAKGAVARAEEVVRETRAIVHGEIVEGSPTDEIVRRAYEFDLVVMASHGKGAIKQLVLGSVFQGVLPRIDRPILVINCRNHRVLPSPSK